MSIDAKNPPEQVSKDDVIKAVNLILSFEGRVYANKELVAKGWELVPKSEKTK